MFRLSKITDYGIVILAHLASHSLAEADEDSGRSAQSLNARELAEQVDLPVPVVSKVLKTLTRAGVLESQRGAKGGYSLAHRPEELTVAEMITALDGPLALTQCNLGPHVCELDASCAVKSPWLVINRVVHYALSSVTLADLTNPDFATQHAPLAGLGVAGLDVFAGLTGSMPGLTDPALLERTGVHHDFEED
jgi:FeS assembly SUF system regulator